MAAWRDERGFTLPELLVGFALLGFVLVAVVTIHQRGLQVYADGSNKTEAQQNARVALERLARELRQTPLPLTVMNAGSLTLIERDPVTEVDTEVSYALIDGGLTRTVAGASELVIGGLQALTFTYTYCAGCAATPANLRRVDITVQTRSEDTMAGGLIDSRTAFTTSVQLRNL